MSLHMVNFWHDSQLFDAWCVYRAPHNDYSPTSLQAINDSLYLNVFDEYLVDISQVIFSHIPYGVFYIALVTVIYWQCLFESFQTVVFGSLSNIIVAISFKWKIF